MSIIYHQHSTYIGPVDISQEMERSGFDLAVRGLISSRIGLQLSSGIFILGLK